MTIEITEEQMIAMRRLVDFTLEWQKEDFMYCLEDGWDTLDHPYRMAAELRPILGLEYATAEELATDIEL